MELGGYWSLWDGLDLLLAVDKLGTGGQVMPHKVEIGTVLLEDLPHALNALFERWPNATLTWARVKLAEEERSKSFARTAGEQRTARWRAYRGDRFAADQRKEDR